MKDRNRYFLTEMRFTMKKLTAMLLCLSVLFAACGAPTGENSPAGNTETAAGTESSGHAGSESPAQGAEGAEDTGGIEKKPQLVLMGQEETDISRAVQNKKGAGGDVRTSFLYASQKVPKASGKEYTVMIYIVGSNLESRYGAATNDIREMTDAGLDYSRSNLLVYTGGSKRWTSDISNTYNSVLDLSGGEALEVTAQTAETADMGTPETLADFINYCTANYPAKHYGLVLWDHGAGPLWGYGSDELFGNDSLLLEELRAAMDKTVFGREKKLDWVGFDACLMGSIENAGLWKDYADYLVGSEELESGRGWDYSFLSALNKTSDAREIVTAAVDSYAGYYEANRSDYFNPDVTLAALDLSKTDEVMEKTGNLFRAMSGGIEEGQYAALNQARMKTKAFGLSAASGREDAYDLLDLRDLAGNLSALYPAECEEVSGALDAMIVQSASNVSGAGGVSIYLPGDNRELYAVAGDLSSGESALPEAYSRFVEAYMNTRMEGEETDWTLGQPVQRGNELTLQLTEGQAANCSQAYYTILNRNSFGGYAINTARVAVEPDEDHVLHIPADPMLLTAETDMEQAQAPLTCVQTESSGGESVYRTVGTYLTSGHEFKDVDVSEDEQVVIMAKNTDGESAASILDITSSAGSAWAGGKESVDVTDYRSVINAGSISYLPLRDADGHMEPFTNWKANGYEMYPMCLDKGFRITMKHASDFALDFICQVTIKDVNGDVHGSEYAELEIDRQRETQEVPTEKGTLQAEIREDHAEIIGYEGEDEVLEIPETAAGKPVTAIGRSAFHYCGTLVSVRLPDTVTEIGDEAFFGTSALKEVSLPAGLKKIGIAAFRSSGLEEIRIPDSVEVIGRGAFDSSELTSVKLPDGLVSIGSIPFGRCENLRKITISGDNPAYKTPGGVLYTKDGKTLIQYPGAGEEDYRVEDGTEVIGYGAFSESAVKNVSFPEGLKTIENMAFYECEKLAGFELPDSLESIGDLAFGEFTMLTFFGDEKPHFESVHIGPNVRHIGVDAFFALETEAFDVDEANEQFASEGGFITSKARDMILQVPRGMQNPVVIPEGITTLQDGLFADCEDNTEFIVPDSVFRFGEEVFPFTYGEQNEEGRYEILYEARLHCSEGSAAQEYAELYSIPSDRVTDAEDLIYEEVTEEETNGDGGTVKMTFHVFRDRAELVRCAADQAGALVIPDTFRGLPVTAIRPGSTSSSPGSLFCTKIVIPASVKEIEWEFFGDFYMLEEIEVAEANTSYKSIDGVLLSGDGKTLIGYPVRRKDAEYTVPDKVTAIGDKAAYLAANLQKVTFPRSLRTIGRNAFAASSLTTVEFAKGLKEIGDRAFNGAPLKDVTLPDTIISIGNSAFTLSESFGRIVMPARLEKLGYSAFSAGYRNTFTQDVIRIPARLAITGKILQGVLFERYEVDEKSENYTAEDGLLLSKDGRTLVSVPTLLEGDLIVPEGILYISFSALDDCANVTDIYLPDSVLDIGGIAQKNYETGEYMYKIHCRKGTEAQKKLEARGVPWIEKEK